MLVSLKWLSKYINLPMTHQELALRLSLSGLNHEETETINGDVVVDLEVTGDRGDCLGHIGVAREIGVLVRTCRSRDPWPAIYLHREPLD